LIFRSPFDLLFNTPQQAPGLIAGLDQALTGPEKKLDAILCVSGGFAMGDAKVVCVQLKLALLDIPLLHCRWTPPKTNHSPTHDFAYNRTAES
jgi:hypothetical protein